MSDSEVDYLQPGFDPASITMPRLRSIMVNHNVDYPSTAKKAQLVEVFNEKIRPQAKKILERRARAKRSSMGITNIDNSVGYSVANDDMQMPPPTTSKARGRPKRNPASAASSFKTASEEPEQTPSARTLSPSKRSQRSTSRQLGYSDTDTDSHYESRRSTRKSSHRYEMTPQPEVEQVQESEDDRDNVFSTDNPFQSGSSPLPEETPTNRRKTSGFESPVKKRPTSSGVRRRTEEPKDLEAEPTVYTKPVETPRKTLPRPKTPQPPTPPTPARAETPRAETPQLPRAFEEVEASEEFTPEEQLALAQEDALRAQTAVVPHRQQRRSGGLGTPLSVLLLTLLGAYGAWYRQEKVEVGYCGVGRPAKEILPRHVNFQEFDFETPAWAIKLTEPECDLCPAHAYCYADSSVRCEDDYILKPHPLAAGGLVPLPPTCEPDGEKVRRVKAVADKAVEQLRERRAKFECGELLDENGKAPESPAIAVEELKQTVSEQRSKKLSKKEFDDLWSSALGEIETRDEVEVESREVEPVQAVQPHDPSGGRLPAFVASTSLARLSLTCSVRRSFRLGLERYKLSIVSVIVSLFMAFYGRSRYRSNRVIAAQIPSIVDTVLRALAAQKERAYESGSSDDAFLFLPNLRDDILRQYHTVTERNQIWQRVTAVVEQNSNVRTGQREGNNGEVGRAWEWIGPSGAIEGGARRRGLMSQGAEVNNERSDDRSVFKKWEESGSRPMY